VLARWILVVTLLLSFFTVGVGEAASKPNDVCANRLCTKYDPGTRSCYTHNTKPEVARCFIRRAAIHYHQPVSDAIRVAHCESTWRWWIRGHHQGMYQFLWSTWRSTPYGRRSVYSPKWASLGAMWMWRVGRRGEWECR
jgi:hypothetical protein